MYKLKLSIQLTANPILAYQKSAATTTGDELRKRKNPPRGPNDAHQAAEAVDRRFRVGLTYWKWEYAIGIPGGKSLDSIVNGTEPLWRGDHFGVISTIKEESSQMCSYYRINTTFSINNLLMEKSVKEEINTE